MARLHSSASPLLCLTSQPPNGEYLHTEKRHFFSSFCTFSSMLVTFLCPRCSGPGHVTGHAVTANFLLQGGAIMKGKPNRSDSPPAGSWFFCFFCFYPRVCGGGGGDSDHRDTSLNFTFISGRVFISGWCSRCVRLKAVFAQRADQKGQY